MKPSLNASIYGAVVAVAVCITRLTAASAPASAALNDAMPVAQQNALVQKHCAVCHNDAHLNGGLSLQHFDAAQPDPSVAAMMLSKVRDAGALSAAGIPMPDKATQDALVTALTAEAVGASAWTVKTQARIVTASIVREVPRAPNAGAPDIYRLTVTCRADAREGEMQLAWAPGSPEKGAVLSTMLDGKTPTTYPVDGSEKTFKGATGTGGEGAIILSATKSLPERTLTINNLFGDGTVVFPLADLTPTDRQKLATCFAASLASREP